MPETEVYRCPCCGQIAPLVRLTEEGPFPLQKYLQTYGGKLKLTEEDRLFRRGMGFRRGSAPGNIQYFEQEVTEELRRLVKQRLSEVQDEL